MAVPQGIKNSLDRYVKEGTPTGGFLYAVLSNDLFEAFGRADIDNRMSLFDICSYIYGELPSTCHGSREIVNEWIDKFTKKETENGEVQKKTDGG
jgi:hypothetical protein